MKRALSILLVVVMIAMLAGCTAETTTAGTTTAGTTTAGTTTAGTTTAGEAKEVFLFSSVGAYKTLLEEQVQAWNEGDGAAKGVKIVMETNIDDYSTACLTMITAGNAPDLFDCYNNADWIAAGYNKDLYKVAGVEDLIERFKPYLVQGANLRGDMLVALPLEVLPIKMVYNKDIFDKCGLTAAPKTWAEMADYAKIITEKGNGDFYGFGWTTMWTASFRRLALKATMNSVGKGWFDNNTGTYDFTPFKPAIEAIAKMYQDGSMFPTPMDQHIDPIRQRFSEGLVGMEIAPAYDISVYGVQFPCNFNWAVADVPNYEAGPSKYQRIALNRANVSISSSVTDDRLPAVVEAFHFMHSKELYAKLYANCAIIPHEADIIANTKLEKELNGWKEMSDTKNYIYMPPFPDALITLEGDNYGVIFEKIMTGATTFDKEITSLNKRYNDAYQAAKTAGKIDTKVYESAFDMTIK